MTGQVRVAVLVSRIRVEEKLLLTALETGGAAVQIVNDDVLVLPVVNLTPSTPPSPSTGSGQALSGALPVLSGAGSSPSIGKAESKGAI